MRRFGGAVPGLPPGACARCHPFGHQGRGRHDESIQQHRCAPNRRLGAESGNRCHVGTTAGRQQCDRIRSPIAGPVQRITHGRGLTRPGGVVDTGAPAHGGYRFGTCQCGDQSGSGGGIADTHIAGDQKIRSGIDLLVGDPPASFDGCCRLVWVQCVFNGDVPTGATHLVRCDCVIGCGIAIHRDVHHPHRGPADRGEHIDRRTTGLDVGHHLGSDLRWVRRHTLGGDTVVAGEHNDAGTVELLWGTIALARSNPDGKIFQPAQRAVWLGQQVLAATCRRASPSIRRCNIGELHQFDAVSGGLTQSGWPAITSTTLSQHSAILWFTTPSSSANRRPAAVAGITVKPTSGLTRTSGAPNEPTAATS